MDSLAIARRLFLKRLARYGVTAALFTGGGKVFAGSEVALTGIRISQKSEDHTRVVFDLSSGVKYKLFTLSNPPRVVVDLKGTRESNAFFISNAETNLMRTLRSANKSSGDLRVVLDLNSKVSPRSFSLQPDGSSGHRVVIDLHSSNLGPTPIKTSQREQPKRKKEYIIAVDAGHGGRDPGAVGKKGTREKDITLAVAKKIKVLINRTPGYRAVLTRDSDRYIALRNRVKIARDNQADLFLSIHADSFKSPKVEGGSVYALSLSGASSEAAKWIAEKENASDLFGGISLDDKDDLIASVLLDLSQTATIQDSRELGSSVLKQMGKVSKLNNKKVQHAGFAVLKAPDMPSILIETAFLSNPKEERKLRSSKHQQKLANAIFSGIKVHLKNRQV
jgi:N-acetylmuramoyl-L-alanine amidase